MASTQTPNSAVLREAPVTMGSYARGMNDYKTTSRDYLTRARCFLSSGDTASLFYSAFELRCGIEARLHEYLDGARDIASVKSGLWQIKHLGRQVENKFDIYSKAVVVTLINQETKEEVIYAYTPVTARLRKIGEMLGSYLHHVSDEKIKRKDYLDKLKKHLTIGIKELEFSTSGTLLGPPRFSKSDRKHNMHLIFESHRAPEFLREGDVGLLRMRLKVVKKDEINKSITFKPD
jgi:hypothetical protein